MMPDGFAELEMTAWSEWVLDNGLPPLPDTVHRGESVPVARWDGDRYGAVLHVQWSWGGSDPDDDDLVSELEDISGSSD